MWGCDLYGQRPKLAEHGGFAHDDTNVMLLVENPAFYRTCCFRRRRENQVAPTILQALGLNPESLQAVQIEGTPVLPKSRSTSSSGRRNFGSANAGAPRCAPAFFRRVHTLRLGMKTGKWLVATTAVMAVFCGQAMAAPGGQDDSGRIRHGVLLMHRRHARRGFL